MGRHPSKKTRETAAQICAVMCQHDERQRGWTYVCADFGVRVTDPAARLAMAASDAVFDCDTSMATSDLWAEAEALVRSGFCIGDPAYLIKLPVETDTVASPFNEARSDAATDSIPVEPEDDEDPSDAPCGSPTLISDEYADEMLEREHPVGRVGYVEPRPDPVADAIEDGDAETADEEMTSTYEDDTPEDPDEEPAWNVFTNEPVGGEG